MKAQTHFVVANIDNIKIFPVKQLQYKWYEYSERPVLWFWGKLKVGTDKWKPGWCDGGGFAGYYDWNYDLVKDRHSSWFLINKDYFFIGDTDTHEGTWFERAKVIVNKTRGDQMVRYFESDGKAMEWVESLKDKSENEFEIIIAS